MSNAESWPQERFRRSSRVLEWDVPEQMKPSRPNAPGPFAGACEMLAALREKRVSAMELLDLHLERIERLNPTFNAIVIKDFEHARDAAADADAKRAAGMDAPLLGLPVTFKDCIDVRWMRGPAGEPEHSERRPRNDAPVVASIRESGAVLMGKTNVPPLASDWQCSNSLFGRTVNPWDLTRTPGGSTGGGAAALACGLTPLEFGSDISGSIRVPAAFCGVYGHKPSETAVPRSGHFPGSPLPNSAAAMQVMGPLTRTAEDLRLAMENCAGPEIGEAVAWKLQLPEPRHRELSDFRVAVLPAFNWLPLDEEIAETIESLSMQLRCAGCCVQTAAPASLGDLKNHHRLFSSLLGVMTATGRPAEECKEQASKDCEDEFEEAYCRAFCATAADYLSWHDQREQIRASFRDFFREWDILLAPADIVNAFPYGDPGAEERWVKVNDAKVEYYLQLVYPGVASLPGHPSTCFPAGITKNVLPIGVQAIGPYLEDFTSIEFAALVAKRFGGFSPPPGFAPEW